MTTQASFPEALGGFAILLLVLRPSGCSPGRPVCRRNRGFSSPVLSTESPCAQCPRCQCWNCPPDLVILLLLPALIFASARELSPQHLRSQGLPILLFATVGVLCTLFLIGLPLYAVTVLPLGDALLFAAAVAATDPSAVSAIFQRFHVPHKLAALIEGESLFNDGTAILLFFTMASLVIGMETFSVTNTALTFGWMVAVAVLLGAALGWCAGRLIRYWSVQNQFPAFPSPWHWCTEGFAGRKAVARLGGDHRDVCRLDVCFQRRPKPSGTDQPAAAVAGHPEFFVGFWDYISQLAGGILFLPWGHRWPTRFPVYLADSRQHRHAAGGPNGGYLWRITIAEAG